jgi:hypothetical protein
VPGADVGPATSTTPLYGVSGSGPDDVWAVGQDSNTNTSLIEHWDGTSWSLVASPANEPANGQLNSVSADSPTDAWAGGYAFPSTITSLIEHWNGTAWTVVPDAAPGNTRIIAIAAISPSDVWALGAVGTGRRRSNVMENWNGSQWSVVTLPVSGILNSISAVSASDVWAVGNDGLIEQWDGTQWSQVANPDGGGADLVAVNALSADDVWTISANGAVTEQWNGTQWSSVPPAASIPAGFAVGGGFIWGGESLSGVAGGPTVRRWRQQRRREQRGHHPRTTSALATRHAGHAATWPCPHVSGVTQHAACCDTPKVNAASVAVPGVVGLGEIPRS